MSTPGGGELAATLRRIERAAGALATASVARMDETLPWFRELPADQRSWVMLVAQAGVAVAGASGCARRRHGGRRRRRSPTRSSAPRRGRWPASITLQQTVAADQGHHRRRRGAGRRTWPRRARSSSCARRCCATPARSPSPPPRSTPGPPSPAAPGTPGWRRWWSTRCCAATPTDVLASRAAALGWADAPPVAVVGRPRPPAARPRAVLHAVYRPARRIGVEVLGGVHGDRLVVVLGGATDPLAATERAARARSATGPVVVGPAVPTPGRGDRVGPGRAGRLPGRAGLAGGAPPGAPPTTCCPSGPWPATATPGAACVTRSTAPLVRAGGALLETLDAFFDRRRRRWRRGPGAVRAPEHRALPAAPGRRGHRLLAADAAGRVHPPDRADRRPAGPVAPAATPTEPT